MTGGEQAHPTAPGHPQHGVMLCLRRWWRGLADTGRERLPFGLAEHEALELLKQSLSPIQREQYEREGRFEVTGGHTGKRYRICHGYQMNVEVIDRKGRHLYSLCFLPKGHLPMGDIMLAQKLALELFESEALAVARKTARLDEFGQMV
jgi:hypothetical protein